MKTFNCLKFKKHTRFDGLQAEMNFKNGYGISVLRFKINISGLKDSSMYGSYTSNDDEWEIAVLYNRSITYDTHITDDVIGHLKSKEVTEIMKQIQRL